MSNSKADNAIDELDLSDIFSLFKRWFYSVLALFFKAMDFLFKFWWAILLVIIIGVVLGKFTMLPTKYKATMIVKTNFDSQSYVYNALEQMIGKISDGDTSFISENKLGSKDNLVLNAEINPIIDVVNFLKKVKDVDDKNLGEVLKRLTVKDDDEALFASEQFYTNYKYHKLELTLLGKDKTLVKNTFNYINNQPSILQIKDGYIINQKEKIHSSDKTVAQIDALLDDYSSGINLSLRKEEKLSYFNNENEVNLDGVLELKREMVRDVEELKNDLITSTDALVTIGGVQIVEDVSFTDKKYIYYPILFVFLFLLAAGVRYSYTTLRKRLIEENFLD